MPSKYLQMIQNEKGCHSIINSHKILLRQAENNFSGFRPMQKFVREDYPRLIELMEIVYAYQQNPFKPRQEQLKIKRSRMKIKKKCPNRQMINQIYVSPLNGLIKSNQITRKI
ncbi:hypothetical protein pb186bvf_009784 [Paramecium bursaria]